MVRHTALSSPVSSSMFTRLLFFWLTGALLLPLNWGTAFVNEEEEEDEEMTPTPDYDYNSTHDYYLYNETYESFEILHNTENQGNTGNQENTGNQGNTNSVSVYKHYAILAGLLVLQICQQT